MNKGKRRDEADNDQQTAIISGPKTPTAPQTKARKQRAVSEPRVLGRQSAYHAKLFRTPVHSPPLAEQIAAAEARLEKELPEEEAR